MKIRNDRAPRHAYHFILDETPCFPGGRNHKPIDPVCQSQLPKAFSFPISSQKTNACAFPPSPIPVESERAEGSVIIAPPVPAPIAIGPA